MVHFYMLDADFKKKKVKKEILKNEINACSKKKNRVAQELKELKHSREALLRKLEALSERIDKLSMENDELEELLTDFNLKLSKITEIIENAKVIKAITVDSCCLENGLVDLNRDILLKLIKIVGDEEKTRNIIGMTETFYKYSKLSVFHWARPRRFHWSMIHKSKLIEVLNDRKSAKVTGQQYGYHIILLHDKKIVRGILKIAVKVVRLWAKCYSFGVLLDMPKTFEEGFGYYTSENPLRGFGYHDSGGIYFDNKMVVSSTLGYGIGDTVAMRVDVGRGDLEYFVNGKKGPSLKSEAHIKKGVYLAAQIFNVGAEWTIVSSEYNP